MRYSNAYLESESNIGTHCKQLLLSASNDGRFRKPCTHGGEFHMLPAVAWEAMKAKFSDMIRVRTKTPMWLEKDQIAEWLAARKAEEKSRRKNKKALEGGLKKKQRVETPIVKAGAGKKRAAPRPAKRPSKSKAARKADSDSDCDSDGGSLRSSGGSAIGESEAEDSGADSSEDGRD